MDSDRNVCEYCKAVAKGSDLIHVPRPDFRTVLSKTGGFVAARQAVMNQKDTQCRCDGLFSIGDIAHDRKKEILKTKVQEYLLAREKQDCSEAHALHEVLGVSITSEDVRYARRVLWNIESITIQGYKGDTLPLAFGSIFSNLKKIALDNNHFSILPETLLKCVRLEHLSFKRNKFVGLPENIGHFKNLKQLDVSENLIRELPKSLSKLKHLRHLSMSRNQLHSLHLRSFRGEQILSGLFRKKEEVLKNDDDWEEMRDLGRNSNSIVYYNKKTGEASNTKPGSSPSEEKPVSYPEDCFGDLSLNFLDVGHNQLRCFPRSFSKLTSLEVLEAPNNFVEDVGPIGKLPRLKRLKLNRNHLIWVSDLPSTIEYLDLSNNRLNHFPSTILEMKMLKSFDLSSNLITKIPVEIGFLKELHSLNVNNNPITNPPYGVMIQSAEKVLWNCRQVCKKIQKQGDPFVTQHRSGICSERTALAPDFQSRIMTLASEAAASNRGLELQFMNIRKIPQEIFHAPCIQRIDLSYNNLLSIHWSRPIDHLKTLIMKSCHLESLDKSIQYLTHLERLDIEGNDIRTIPAELGALRELRFLGLRNNRISSLPSFIGELKELRELNFDCNKVENVPESIQDCKLEVLSGSNNNIFRIDPCIQNLRFLRDLNFSMNCISEVPGGIGKLRLVKLSISSNNIGYMDDGCFSPNLKSTLKILELNENEIRALPHSFGSLSRVQRINLDMNPLQSPPILLMQEGIEPVLKYCAARAKLVEKLTKMLLDEDLEIAPRSLIPPASNVLLNGIGFLRPDDLSEFDAIVDRSINESFFLKPQSMAKIVKHIRDRRDIREKECHKKVIDTCLEVIRNKYVVNQSINEREYFRSDVYRSFSVLEKRTKCFALPLDQVILQPRGETSSLFAEVKMKLRSLDSIFHFDDKSLFKALKYKSPCGPVASIKDKIEYCQNGVKKTKISLVLQQIVYSDEEFSRMETEERLLKKYFCKLVGKIVQWSTEETRSVHSEVSKRIRKIKQQVVDTKRAVATCRSAAINEIKVKQKSHKFSNGSRADEILDDIKKYKEKLEIDIQKLEEEHRKAKSAKQRSRRDDIKEEAITDMQKKYFHSVYKKVVCNGRAFAMANKIRRPWDEDFEGDQCQGESKVVLSESDLHNHLEKYIDCVQFSWADMECMSKFENELFERFQNSTMLDKAVGLLKIKHR